MEPSPCRGPSCEHKVGRGACMCPVSSHSPAQTRGLTVPPPGDGLTAMEGLRWVEWSGGRSPGNGPAFIGSDAVIKTRRWGLKQQRVHFTALEARRPRSRCYSQAGFAPRPPLLAWAQPPLPPIHPWCVRGGGRQRRRGAEAPSVARAESFTRVPIQSRQGPALVTPAHPQSSRRPRLQTRPHAGFGASAFEWGGQVPERILWPKVEVRAF